jgi:hypothetical protein
MRGYCMSPSGPIKVLLKSVELATLGHAAAIRYQKGVAQAIDDCYAVEMTNGGIVIHTRVW